MKTKVTNMTSTNGNSIPNQFIIETEDYIFFQSYETVIARKRRTDGQIALDSNSWDYSKTTGKYRNIFLGETKKETERKIKEGVYVLAPLND